MASPQWAATSGLDGHISEAEFGGTVFSYERATKVYPNPGENKVVTSFTKCCAHWLEITDYSEGADKSNNWKFGEAEKQLLLNGYPVAIL